MFVRFVSFFVVEQAVDQFPTKTEITFIVGERSESIVIEATMQFDAKLLRRNSYVARAEFTNDERNTGILGRIKDGLICDFLHQFPRSREQRLMIGFVQQAVTLTFRIVDVERNQNERSARQCQGYDDYCTTNPLPSGRANDGRWVRLELGQWICHALICQWRLLRHSGSLFRVQGHRADAGDIPIQNRLVRPLRCTARSLLSLG